MTYLDIYDEYGDSGYEIAIFSLLFFAVSLIFITFAKLSYMPKMKVNNSIFLKIEHGK